MTIRVQTCWNGRNILFRIKLPAGGHESIAADQWDRKTASKALDLLQNVYGLKRQNVRFYVA